MFQLELKLLIYIYAQNYFSALRRFKINNYIKRNIKHVFET